MLRLQKISMVAVVLAGVGCGADPHVEGRPETVAVTGKVTYNGTPVEGASVTFHAQQAAGAPGQGEAAHSAFGRTDSNGEFQLRTFEPGDGAVPGEYRVSISKYEAAADTGATDEENYVPPEEGEPLPTPESLLPVEYSNPQTSELTANVTREGENHFPFELTE
jgi:hypothetical protein